MMRFSGVWFDIRWHFKCNWVLYLFATILIAIGAIMYYAPNKWFESKSKSNRPVIITELATGTIVSIRATGSFDSWCRVELKFDTGIILLTSYGFIKQWGIREGSRYLIQYNSRRGRLAIKLDSENAVQWKTVQMRVTAYCPCSKCCGSYSDGITASGHKISQGDRFVAADKTYPFGTEMLIPGYNTGDGYKNSKKCDNSNEHKNSKECESSKNNGAVEVLDRGGAIRGKRLDVFFNTHQEALEWGVRHLDVKIREQ